MTATNHALTGAVIGLVVGQPLTAVPAAFLSHFVLDALPHFGDDNLKFTSKKFTIILASDILLCALLAAVLALKGPEHYYLAAWCAFFATSPDFMWLPDFIRARKHHKKLEARGFLVSFHGRIQWFQRPIGGVVEAAWAVGMVTILAKLI